MYGYICKMVTRQTKYKDYIYLQVSRYFGKEILILERKLV